jgi:hypothetical protein
MSHKLGICIPYRNRKEHLDKLVPHLSEHLTKQGINHTFYVGHQVDNKLFNRGAMKNIAAKHAFEDGCDYIAWHDVDMLPQEDADYSYPSENPVHISTKLSKYNYGMGYDQYFGGVVLFTKEQVEKTNGYSNDYWDWGMEDDDLFWRAYFEGMTTGDIFKEYESKKIGVFNGINSHVEIPANRKLVECLNKNHTISFLVCAEQQPDKVPIWLIGDKEKKFIEYPIFVKTGGYNYTLSFNNSRAFTMKVFNERRTQIYNWIKRFESLWTWVTLSIDAENNQIYFYLNNELTRNQYGTKENLPISYEGKLMRYDLRNPFMIGFDNFTNTRFKGKIARIKLYNKFFNNDDINNIIDDKLETPVLDFDFNNLTQEYKLNNIDLMDEEIQVIENIIPFRREGNFDCLSHVDEGYVDGIWKKGETTARNEKRFVSEMQQGRIDYKNDGMNSLKYELKDVSLDGKVMMINVTL